MLTRLMYGGRVSLMIGFIVIIIETVLGVILGGIAGYFLSLIHICPRSITGKNKKCNNKNLMEETT